MNATPIRPSNKNLGVDISENLTCVAHRDRTSKKAIQILGFLRRNIKIKSQSIKSIAYQTLVRPQLQYSSEVWSPYTNTQIDQIKHFQRRAAR
jgi:hypothetical protein